MKRIILYDTDDAQRTMIGVTLSSWGFDVATVRNDDELMDAYAAQPSFLIVSCADERVRLQKLLKRIAVNGSQPCAVIYCPQEYMSELPELFRLGVCNFICMPIELHRLRFVCNKTFKTVAALESKTKENEFLLAEERTFAVPDDLARLISLVRHMTYALPARIDGQHIFRYCVHNLLENALLYGALGLTSAQIMTAYESDTLAQLIDRARASGKRKPVTARYVLGNDAVCITIADNGPGFDWRAMFTAIDRGDDAAGGHSIALARSYFDEFRYNEPGNEVTAVKKLKNVQ
ncbi:MAG: ATP-binding protein [Spirochaetes bacterium]|nr:ATP-binding protein [Spirochaetota bacterium]